ncbi:hypothetical protein EJB05_49868, partial [Eragrostis curvula]
MWYSIFVEPAEGQCSMYGICGQQSDGKVLNCVNATKAVKVNITVTVDAIDYYLWVSSGSRAADEKNYFDSHFAPFYRIEQLVLATSASDGSKAPTFVISNEVTISDSEAPPLIFRLLRANQVPDAAVPRRQPRKGRRRRHRHHGAALPHQHPTHAVKINAQAHAASIAPTLSNRIAAMAMRQGADDLRHHQPMKAAAEMGSRQPRRAAAAEAPSRCAEERDLIRQHLTRRNNADAATGKTVSTLDRQSPFVEARCSGTNPRTRDGQQEKPTGVLGKRSRPYCDGYSYTGLSKFLFPVLANAESHKVARLSIIHAIIECASPSASKIPYCLKLILTRQSLCGALCEWERVQRVVCFSI